MRLNLLTVTMLALALPLAQLAQAQTSTSNPIGSITASPNVSELYQFTPQNFGNAKVQTLFTSADLAAAGVPVTAVLQGVQWYVVTDNSPNTYTFSVGAANTTLTTLPSGAAFYAGVLSTVAPSASDAGTINGWHTALFTTSFTRDGSNLILQTCRSGSSQGSDQVNVNASAGGETYMVSGYNHACNATTGYYSVSSRPTFRFLYTTAAPALTSISPASGSVGASVTITGFDLTGTTKVTFGGTSNNTVTTGLTVNGASGSQTLTVNVPTGATTGSLTVTTPTGTSNGLTFTLTCPPTATAQNASLTLAANGAGTLAATAVNNGSTANCNPATTNTLSVAPNTFSCADVAPATVASALLFSGSQYVQGTNAQLPMGNTARTIEAWVYPTAASSNGIIFNYGTPTDNLRSGILLSNGNLYYVGENHDIRGNIALTVNSWNHVAATYDGSILSLYVNGVLDVQSSAGAFNFNTTGTTWRVAQRSYPQTGEFLTGGVDEVRVWNVARTAAQIAAFKSIGLPGSSAGLVANYRFSEGSGTTTADASASASTGTLYSNPSWMTNSPTLVNGLPVLLTVTDSNNNTSTAPAAVTVLNPAAATITSLSPASGAVGQTITVSGTNLGAATGLSVNGTTAAISSNTGSSFTFVVPSGATATGNVVVSAPCLPASAAFSVVNDLVVSTATTVPAGTYNSITVTGTGNGTLAGNVVVNNAVTVQSGGTLTDGCFVLTGAGSFTLAAGGTLGICSAQGITPSGATGTVQLSGTRSFSTDASYVYNGTAVQNTGTGLPAMVRNLTTTNASNVTLSAATSVVQILTVASSGNLVLNNQILTLLATPPATALVVNSGTGIVSGTTAVAQTYLDPTLNAGPGYRHLSAPVSNATVASLGTATFTPNVSQGSAYNASTTPGTVTPFPNVFSYDQSRLATVTNNLSAFDKGFTALTSSSSSLNPGFGYAVNMSAGQVVSFPGQLFTGSNPFPLARGAAGSANAADAGWQLMGNPYPAPYDYSLVLAADRTGLDAAMYVFASTSQYAGNYRSYVNGVGGNPVLALGQAFWLRVSSGQTSGSYTFRNAQRLTTPTATTLQRGTSDDRPLVQLDLRGATGPADAFFAYAQAGATADFDAQLDAVKRANTTGLNLASRANGAAEGLAIDARPAFTAATVLPLTLGVPAAGTYTLSATALHNLPTGLNAYLHDAATGQTLNLSLQPTYAFSVSAAQAAGLDSRFSLHFSSQAALATTAALSAEQVTLFPNPAHAGFTVLVPAVAGTSQLRAELFNTLGQVVRQLTAALPADGTRLQVNTVGLAVGVYTLRLHAGPTALVKRVVLQ